MKVKLTDGPLEGQIVEVPMKQPPGSFLRLRKPTPVILDAVHVYEAQPGGTYKFVKTESFGQGS